MRPSRVRRACAPAISQRARRYRGALLSEDVPVGGRGLDRHLVQQARDEAGLRRGERADLRMDDDVACREAVRASCAPSCVNMRAMPA